MTTAEESTKTVGITDLVGALPGMLADTPTLLRGALTLASLRPTSRQSIGRTFQRAAARHPHRVFLRFEDRALTYGEANEQINRYASVLSGYGVRQGAVVGILMTNRPETLLVALAAVKLGAVAGLYNYNQRGEVLDHSQRLLGATVTVVGAECAEALGSLPEDSLSGLGTVFGLAEGERLLPGHPDLDEAAADGRPTNPVQCDLIRADATAFYIFTSGTTGMPKASAMSHYRWLEGMVGLGELGVRLRGDDTLYCCLPLYHNNAVTVSLSAVLSAGATLALGRSFSVTRFWDEVIQHDATAFSYIGELCRYLLSQPSRPAEREHRVRVVVGNGLRPEIWSEFKRRFGIDRIAEFYGASECNLAFINALNLDRTAGMCPLPFAVVEYETDTEAPYRAADDRLREVRVGEVGLLLTEITDRAPYDGYTDRRASEKKVITDAFKAGDRWFNTGDLVRKQGWGHVAFVDRLGDTFRWKGENVATTEVEAVLLERDEIESAVVFGVAIPGTDGKAGMAAIELHHGAAFDGPNLAAHLARRLPAYEVPLFVRVVEKIEQTSTFKSRKVDLRNEAYDADAISDPLYVYVGDNGTGEKGYIPWYPEYPADVASGAVRV